MCQMWGWDFPCPTFSPPALGLGQVAGVPEWRRPQWVTQPIGLNTSDDIVGLWVHSRMLEPLFLSEGPKVPSSDQGGS